MRGSFKLALVVAVGVSGGPAFGQQAPSANDAAAHVQALTEKTGAQRLAAIDALIDHGPAAAPATAALAKLLSDPDEATQIRAARALGAIGPDAAAAVDALTAAIESSNPKVRAYVLHALGRIGEKAQGSFPKVAEQVTSEDPQVRREAVKAVRHMKLPLETTVPMLLKILESAKSTEEVMPALQAMSEVGKEGVPRLVEAMQKFPAARYWICRILSDIGPDAAAAVPAVLDVLTDERTDVRREAVLCLGHIGKAAAAAAPPLTNALTDKDAGIRAAAVWSLMMIEAPAAETLAAVKGIAADKDEMVRLVAAWSLAKLEPSNADQRRASLDMFIAALGHENPRIRAAAARAIVDLKTGDQAAREALAMKLADGDPEVSAIVTRALVEAGAEAVPLLLKGLERPELRGYAAHTLGMLGANGKAAVPALTAALADENVHVRAAALHSLGSIAPDDADVVAKLVAALADKSTDVRLAAIDSLAMNKAAAPAAKPELEKLLQDSNPAVREAAAFAIEMGKTK